MVWSLAGEGTGVTVWFGLLLLLPKLQSNIAYVGVPRSIGELMLTWVVAISVAG